MENMKSLADQLREQLVKPTDKQAKKIRKVEKRLESAILEAIISYDNSDNKNMVHTRFDKKTVKLMNQFKMATDVDVTKLVAFAVKHLFESYPELKTIIKQFIQNEDL
jgi:predicted glycosyl hydrolase (DUF1957 family)